MESKAELPYMGHPASPWLDPMGEKFNPLEESSYLQYLEVNNLYGWAMSQSLPTGGFRWVSIEPNEIGELARHRDKGYLLEVDVSCPEELHDLHNDLPFMCERKEKLVPSLYGKRNCIIHIRALDQALSHGLILEHIHRATEFDQSA